MKMSHLFSQTLREAPADAETISHQLMLRAGLIRQLGTGIYTLMPLGKRAVNKIEAIIREEMEKIGGQEISMPVVNPASVWKETKRYYQIGDEMARFQDRYGRDMVLAMTHEEVVADLIRKEIQSYRQLPALVYHLQTKWRDDARPRAGLIRVREFTMKDSYSIDADEAGLDKQYRAHYQTYFDIFNRCALPSIAVMADVGMMGGKMSHEYMYLTPIGEDTIIICDTCGYHANRQIALFKKPAALKAEPQALEKVATPNASTIEDLAAFLNIQTSQTAKAVFMMATITEDETDIEKLVFALVRGDMEVNETKLANAVKAKELRPAHEEEITAIGATAGYASPIGIKKSEDLIIVADDLVAESNNLVSGANQKDYHYINVNYGRDFKADIITDITVAEAGCTCVKCGGELSASRGVEIGNIFKLGTRYTDALGATYLGQNGKPAPVVMGSYGIGVGRLFACVVEEHNDDRGLIFPITVAPYQIHLIALKKGEEKADELYEQLQTAGFDVLYDDRNESPGVKFNDADLLGMPIRITVSKRSIENGGVEFKLRKEEDREVVAFEDLMDKLIQTRQMLFDEINAKVVEVPFDAN